MCGGQTAMPAHMESVAVLGCENIVCHVQSPLLGTSNVSGGWAEVCADGRTRGFTERGIAVVNGLKFDLEATV